MNFDISFFHDGFFKSLITVSYKKVNRAKKVFYPKRKERKYFYQCPLANSMSFCSLIKLLQLSFAKSFNSVCLLKFSCFMLLVFNDRLCISEKVHRTTYYGTFWKDVKMSPEVYDIPLFHKYWSTLHSTYDSFPKGIWLRFVVFWEGNQ